MIRDTIVLSVFLTTVPVFCSVLIEKQNPMPIVVLQVKADNAEGQLAIGRKFRFSSADMYDLELIPGVSDKTAARILDARTKVLERAATLPMNQRYHAFVLVHGVGQAIALKFDRYIDLE